MICNLGDPMSLRHSVVHHTIFNTTLYIAAPHSIYDCNTPQHPTTPHNTPQHTTTHHNTPQHIKTHHSRALKLNLVLIVHRFIFNLRVSQCDLLAVSGSRPDADDDPIFIFNLRKSDHHLHLGDYHSLQHTATHCNATLYLPEPTSIYDCNIPERTTLHCNRALHFNTLQLGPPTHCICAN